MFRHILLLIVQIAFCLACVLENSSQANEVGHRQRVPVMDATSSLVSFVELRKTETYDCGKGVDPFKLVSLDLTPDPIIYPGSVDMAINATLAEDLPNEGLMMKLNVLKIEPFRMTVPCFQGIGSCTYDVCSDMIPNHQEQFCNIGACKCPLTKGVYTNLGKDRMHVNLPNLGGSIIAKILQGNFEANITFYNKHTQVEYACLGMKFAIKAK